MSRDGNGNYSLASGNPVVAGTTITDTWANNTLADIATAITQSLSRDGQTVPTANLPMATFKHTGAGDASGTGQYLVYGQATASYVNGSFGVGGAANSGWTSPALQVKGGSLWSNGLVTDIFNNLFFDGTNVKYIATSSGGMYQLYSDGSHRWNIAPSGTSGATATLTQAMTLDPNGNLLVGSTSASWNNSGRGLVEVNGSTSALVGLKVNNVQGGYVYHNGSTLAVSNLLAGSVALSANGITGLTVSSTGVLTDQNGIELGWKGIPQLAKTGAYTIAHADIGKHISITTGGVTVPSGVFSVGDAVTVYNNSATSQTITQGAGATMYLAGSSSTGNRSLGQHGICTILCVATDTFVMCGAGLS